MATFPKVVNSYCNSSTGEELPQAMTGGERKRRETKFPRVLLLQTQGKQNKTLQSEGESDTYNLTKIKDRWKLQMRTFIKKSSAK